MANLETTPSVEHFIPPKSQQSDRIVAFIHEHVDESSDQKSTNCQPQVSDFWQSINDTETSLWLDSGDVQSVEKIWNPQFGGLTTNNALLNKEIQRGTYDQLVPKMNSLFDPLPAEERVREIAFALNGLHAYKLAQRFHCSVSVELHTDLAHDIDTTVAYARRCHEICPSSFIVKVPLTPAGIVATRHLRDEGIRVNCTLGFSARQNYVVTALARPSYVNVFLGRLNSYVADNQLGDGSLVGEKATMASQGEVDTFSRGLPTTDTQQIAASLRDASQLPLIAGVDVITMPTNVARQAEEILRQPWQSQRNEQIDVKLNEGVDPESVRIEKLWDVRKSERNFVQKAILMPPANDAELQQMAKDHHLSDLFPVLGDAELQTIAQQGKIPDHSRWAQKIFDEEVAIDSLMTFAGLASFAASQAELDNRIRQLLHHSN